MKNPGQADVDKAYGQIFTNMEEVSGASLPRKDAMQYLARNSGSASSAAPFDGLVSQMGGMRALMEDVEAKPLPKADAGEEEDEEEEDEAQEDEEQGRKKRQGGPHSHQEACSMVGQGLQSGRGKKERSCMGRRGENPNA